MTTAPLDAANRAQFNSPAPSPPAPDYGEHISVVIPAYNYAHFLPETIPSVLTQTWTNFELIIVDDGSTDNTAEVCRSFLHPAVRYVPQANAGLSAARNTGISEARYPFVAFLDADDRWLPTFLTRVVQEFRRLGAAFGAVGTASSRMDFAGAPIPPPRINFLPTAELTAATFCMRNRPLSSSVVVRREVFEQCGNFDTKLRSSEDRDMWIRMTAAGYRFFYLDEPLAVIRRHAQNMSKNAPRMKANSGLVLKRAWRNGAVPRSNIAFWLRAAAIHYFLVARTHFDDRLHFRAWCYLALSILCWPIFLRPRLVAEPPLFRLRAMLHFLRP